VAITIENVGDAADVSAVREWSAAGEGVVLAERPG